MVLFLVLVKAEVPGGWKKLKNEEHHRLCCSLNITILRRTRGVEHVKRMGNMRNTYIILVGKCRYVVCPKSNASDLK